MKLIIITFLLFAGCIQEFKEEPKIELDASMNITKTEVGFNVYSNTGELILEFTKRNSDSPSLKALDYVYHTAKEFYNKREFEEEKPKVEGTKSI